MAKQIISEYIKSYGIGITGGVASGKSYIISILKKLGYDCFDADSLAREVCQSHTEEFKKIVEIFGVDFINENNELNRQKIAEAIFRSKEKKILLESILHPAIWRKLQEKVSNQINILSKPWFYEASLIIESKAQNRFKEIWLVYCSKDQQLMRLKHRNQIDTAYANLIIQNQQTFQEKKPFAKKLISTDSSKEKVYESIKNLMEQIKRDFH